MTDITIRQIGFEGFDTCLDDLTDILHATVNAGASVGFILPFSMNDSRSFWSGKVLPALKPGIRILLNAEAAGRAVGTVQLDMDVFPNQVHRGEVSKLLVHPDFRGRGIGKLLMAELERRARAVGKSLLTLDTRTGDTAEPLYRALGYQTAGVIPGFCRAPEEERFDATTYMYKVL